MDGSLSSALQRLANYRANNCRASEEVVQTGLVALRKGGLKKLGDDSWAFLEQLTLAAIDVGNYQVADDTLTLLADRFPESPRVDILQGIRIEATEQPQRALEYYEPLLQMDESNAAAWKRKIAVTRSLTSNVPSNTSTSRPTPQQQQQVLKAVVEELSNYLETFYTDVEAWLELADVYTSVGQFTHALQSLSHAMLLAPQNPFYVIQSAQTAFDAGDVNLACRFFLRAVEIANEDVDVKEPKKVGEDSVSLRCWYGVKLCVSTLYNPGSGRAVEVDRDVKPISSEHLKALDELATKQIAAFYSIKGATGREEALKWLQTNSIQDSAVPS